MTTVHATTEQKTEGRTAKRAVRAVDTYIRLTPDLDRWRGESDESWEKRLTAWGQELEAFIRDHRSQDRTSVYVEVQREAQCDQCGKPWEPDTQDGVTYCAYCGVEVAK